MAACCAVAPVFLWYCEAGVKCIKRMHSRTRLSKLALRRCVPMHACSARLGRQQVQVHLQPTADYSMLADSRVGVELC